MTEKKMHPSGKVFLEKTVVSAKKAFGDDGLTDIVYAERQEDHVIFADNYERFFSYEWKLMDNGDWFIKPGYDADWKVYTESQAFQDADILFTG